MLLKKIDVLRCTFMLVFVIFPMLISSPVNAKLAVADGEYWDWEEFIKVKSRKVVFCGGDLFNNEGDMTSGSFAKCKGWKFTTSSRNVVKAKSPSGDVHYFCHISKLRSQSSCGPSGWRKTPVSNAP
jgi:hypothetical protein